MSTAIKKAALRGHDCAAPQVRDANPDPVAFTGQDKYARS